MFNSKLLLIALTASCIFFFTAYAAEQGACSLPSCVGENGNCYTAPGSTTYYSYHIVVFVTVVVTVVFVLLLLLSLFVTVVFVIVTVVIVICDCCYCYLLLFFTIPVYLLPSPSSSCISLSPFTIFDKGPHTDAKKISIANITMLAQPPPALTSLM